MSSQGYQFVKKTRKFHMNPESTGEQVISSMKFGSTRTGGADNFAISSQGASASGKREMNLVSSGGTGFFSLDEALLLVHPIETNYPHLHKDSDLVLIHMDQEDHTVLEPIMLKLK